MCIINEKLHCVVCCTRNNTYILIWKNVAGFKSSVGSLCPLINIIYESLWQNHAPIQSKSRYVNLEPCSFWYPLLPVVCLVVAMDNVTFFASCTCPVPDFRFAQIAAQIVKIVHFSTILARIMATTPQQQMQIGEERLRESVGRITCGKIILNEL